MTPELSALVENLESDAMNFQAAMLLPSEAIALVSHIWKQEKEIERLQVKRIEELREIQQHCAALDYGLYRPDDNRWNRAVRAFRDAILAAPLEIRVECFDETHSFAALQPPADTEVKK